MPTFRIRDAIQALEQDTWRSANSFSPDISAVHQVLLQPFATNAEREEALLLWLQKKGHQPCLFGRIAAAKGTMHCCIIDDVLLARSDDEIKGRLLEELLAWKRRSLEPDVTAPAHGFMVFLVSRRIAEAAPNAKLLALAAAFRDLWGCTVEHDAQGNDIAVETLYLRDPTTNTFRRFTFSVDYFGAQGDGRWWHDHRVPGGIAFTANSAGHMVRYREWYGSGGEGSEWLTQTAMLTIDLAAATAHGRATWLLDLVREKPFLQHVTCPIAEAKMKPQLQGKDWTRYGGHLYSDHSIRTEFFRSESAKPESFATEEWLEDFAYLYEKSAPDYERFIAGELVNAAEVTSQLGDKASWRTIRRVAGSPLREADEARNSEEERIIVDALSVCRTWASSDEDLDGLAL